MKLEATIPLCNDAKVSVLNYLRDILSISIITNVQKIKCDEIKVKFDVPIGLELFDGTKDSFKTACGNCSEYIYQYGMVYIFLYLCNFQYFAIFKIKSII
jgi:hypothetical protein